MVDKYCLQLHVYELTCKYQYCSCLLKTPSMVITLTVYHHHFGSRYTAYRPTKTILDTSVHIPGVKALPSLIQWNKSLKRSGKNKYITRALFPINLTVILSQLLSRYVSLLVSINRVRY